MPTLAVLAAAMLFATTGTAQALGPDAATPLGVGTLRIIVGAIALWVIVGRSLQARAPLRDLAPSLNVMSPGSTADAS